MSRLASRFPSELASFSKRGRSGRDGYRMVSKGNRDLWLLGFLGFVGFSFFVSVESWPGSQFVPMVFFNDILCPTSEHPARLARPT